MKYSNMNTNPVKILKDEDCVAHVKAQVMTRDDGKGGWVPLGSGGMSTIGLCRTITTVKDETCIEFFILGRRIADKSVILRCALKKELQYTKANPTFHHWKTESGRFGLTFQSSTEARIFEKSIRKLVESLKHGCSEKALKLFRSDDQDHFIKLNLPLEKKDSVSQPESTASTTVSTPSPRSPTSPHSVHHHAFNYVNDHDAANPVLAGSTRHHTSKTDNPKVSIQEITQAAAAGQTSCVQKPFCYFTFPPLNVKPVRVKSSSSCTSLPNHNSLTRSLRPALIPGFASRHPHEKTSVHSKSSRCTRIEADPYVELKRKESEFEYSYPQLDAATARSSSSQNSQILVSDKNIHPSVPGLPSSSNEFLSSAARFRVKTPPTTSRKLVACDDNPSRRLLNCSTKARCVHCQETFVPDENRPGSCPDAPDSVANCIERISCCCCARAFIYHCLSEHEVDQNEEVTSRCCCNERGSCRSWVALAFLSLAVPCLCCYWPMTACHSCGVSCGVCGGKHAAMT